jgi:uncharacterized metal-binding protein YceD (DUF177 family)
MNPLGGWSHAVTDLPAGGLTRARKASPDDCRALAEALVIPAVEDLNVNYRISALPGGGYRLSGDLAGRVIQSCVVSLEPVPGTVADTFNVEFWPDYSRRAEETEKSVLTGPDVELLENGVIDAGRIVFECLSAALDPYPRREGAEFGWRDPADENPAKASPFAVLSKLKR